MALGCFIVQSHHGSRDRAIDRRSWIHHGLVKQTARRAGTVLTALSGDQVTRNGRSWESYSPPNHQRFTIPMPQPLRACCLGAEPKKWLVETNSWKSHPSLLVDRTKLLTLYVGFIYIYCIFNLLFLGLKSKYLVLFVIMEKTCVFFFNLVFSNNPKIST